MVENFRANTFTDRFTQYKKGALRDLTTVLELYYCIPFGKNVRNGVSFSVQFGYTADETQNEVYFGLGETDSAQYLTDEGSKRSKPNPGGQIGRFIRKTAISNFR